MNYIAPMEIPNLSPLFIRFRRSIAICLISISILFAIRFATSGPSNQILVASHAIDAGSILKPDDLALKTTDLSWDGAVDSINSIIGKMTTAAVSAGEPISKSLLRTASRIDPQDSQAVAVTFSLSVSGENLQPGQRIDILASDNFMHTKVVARHALVIKLSHSESNALGTNNNGTITLAVNKNTLTEIASFMGSGTFTFALLSE